MKKSAYLIDTATVRLLTNPPRSTRSAKDPAEPDEPEHLEEATRPDF